MNLATLPPGVPFLDALARWWLHRAGDDPLRLADGLILVPTRRAARALQDAFLPLSGGRPLLLPRVAALGALDEAPLQLAGSLDLPPAVEEQVRVAHLARLIMALDGEYGAPGTADRAWELAVELADLIDEAHRAEVDLPDKLPDAAAAGYAEHWGKTIEFLQIVTSAWPRWLHDNGLLDPAERQVRLLDQQTAEWEARPPSTPVVVAGTTGGIAAVARMIRVVAGLPQGLVLLPGLDLGMPEDTWQALEANHPQAGLRRLLAGLDASRGDVRPWPVPEGTLPSAPPGRATALWHALLPAEALGSWRDGAASAAVPAAREADTSGLRRMDPADQQEEAAAAALALREALEVPGARAALVTPDRQLAVRVAAELLRFGVVADDSAGEALAETPPGAFLRLVARAVADGLRPVALLSLLKHPLAALGLPPGRCREAARHLELACLRGPAPPPGLDGLRAAMGRTRGQARSEASPGAFDLLDRLELRLRPVMEVAARADATPAAALDALLRAAEALAGTDEEPGAGRLWRGEEGEALAAHLQALRGALPVLPAQPVTTLPGLLDASMVGAVVRGRRAVRGRDGGGDGEAEHPRVFIWGLLEARLQTVDLVVLGGLVEGVWPPATDPGPWLSRPMRAAVGLSSPEERQGQLAHDFVMTACAAPRAVLSRPRRRDGAPTVPARWLVRLDAFLRGQGREHDGNGAGEGSGLPTHPAPLWARQLDQPSRPEPVRPPEPRPPVSRRPRSLRVTEVETWLRDPYSIYARYVLRLFPLDPLEPDVSGADYGTLVHAAMAGFLAGLDPLSPYPADASRRLRAAMEAALDEQGGSPALAAWWRPRLHRLADWAAEAERERRERGRPTAILSELTGKWQVPGTARPFEIRGRADRIERLEDGTLAILDYKTGTVPKKADVVDGYAPQLPLEAAMAAAGAFGPEVQGPASELTYWHLTGGRTPGEEKPVFGHDPAAVEEATAAAQDRLVRLVAAYDQPDRAYLSQPAPGEAPRFGEYGQLARVAEWSATEDAP